MHAIRRISYALLIMRIVERFEKQVSLIKTFVNKLRPESSYRDVERIVQLTIQRLPDIGLEAVGIRSILT